MTGFLIRLFDSLNRLFESHLALSLIAAFAWGVLSIVLSPCHLSSIPLAIGFISGRGKLPTSRALFLSFMFSLAILISIAAVGVITGLLGRMLGDIGKIGTVVLAIIFVLVGIWIMDLIPVPQPLKINPNVRGRGAFGAFLLGLLFGLVLGPCAFGFMMPLLLVVFRVARNNLARSISLLTSFALGHAGVIVLAGTFINLVQNYLNWTEGSKAVRVLRIICGGLVVLTGLYLIAEQLK